MSDQSRIEDLRRRVREDPASIAFAQLAEECRRAGDLAEAVRVARDGLRMQGGYLSARVTLGRALLELEQFEEAQAELEAVLSSAPENLTAIRSLAEVHMHRGAPAEALARYRTALAIARNDPVIERRIEQLERGVDPLAPPHRYEPRPRAMPPNPWPLPEPARLVPPPVPPARPSTAAAPPPVVQSTVTPGSRPAPPPGTAGDRFIGPPPVTPGPSTEQRTIQALEQLLDAIHVARAR
jgi:tetratricopeptide (TPR) repeat protein